MKQVSVFVTNKTPLQVAISGHTIPARASNQEIAVYNGGSFLRAVQQAYPKGELMASLKPIELSERPEAPRNIDSPLSAFSEIELSKDLSLLLVENGIESVAALTEKTAKEVLAIKGIGEKSLAEIQTALEAKELSLKEVENDD
ncbi:DNA-directed RNA polymerase subunit alpha C-terminal domain-containing protein [Vibrio parahaemolyticus]|uniref:DNA-directed RNA polymerase subunit alpha C-terminal domain-containing protein n=1 Tax=Vibrio parahaemolyticus TaxID=670 RepID=UPI001123424C|nr:DNA-directed RNA polymerase subunit alpha C-terminal domain-containing protein [Vibrio parahaemolyticus]MBE3985670.1 hypothetical protein [Vibrio parahaemolyticus]MBE4286445.1 hypothetical protein [Vibrio parahaemolyticus]MDF4901767.1 DNA-directed RNA polymerase subunit alpha C-terminal domain-containing protein [Vibrio parahaemolyticus]TOH18937.1 hypothetical protein CGI90_04260 [Vibrio parahaemolyticus]HCG7330485.1 hypothetical protein [Vibrio parahaemolyticus]